MSDIEIAQQARKRPILELAGDRYGIAPEHLPRITERFYRVDRSRSRETGGTGLGLSIVKHVVQRHQGELIIHSQPGQGSSFCIQFPAGRVRTAPSAVAGTGAQHPNQQAAQ